MNEPTEQTDDWSDLLTPENPIKEARDLGENIPVEQYRAQPNNVGRGHPDYIMGGSDLAEFDTCPHRWIRGYRADDEDQTRSTEWGSIIDCILMGGEEDLWRRYALVPDSYEASVMECPECKSQTDSQKCRKCGVDRVRLIIAKPWDFTATTCKEWRAKNLTTGREELRRKVLDEARLATKLILDEEDFADLFRRARKQVLLTGFYDDKDTGVRVPIKSFLDLVLPDAPFLEDLKTTRNAHPRAWRKQVHECGYNVQAARHLDLWNAAHQENRREFRHLVQENFPPYEIARRQLSAEFISMGRERYVRALKRYAECLKTGHWPTYDEGAHPNDPVIDGYLMVSPDAWMVGG